MLDLLEDAVGVKIYDAGRTVVPGDYAGPWLTRPYGVLSQVSRGRSGLSLGDGREVLRGAGDVCYIPARLPRRGFGLSEEEVVIDWVFLRFTLFGSFDVTQLFELPAMLGRGPGARLGEIIKEIAGLVGDVDSIAAAARRKTLGFEALCLLLAASGAKAESAETIRGLERLDPVLRRLNEHYREDLPVDDLARTARLSVSRFHRVFKAALAMSPLEYIKGLRMREAQKLLLFTDAGVAEIAAAVGYHDQFHFSRMFKAAVGVSPALYRRGRGAAAL